MRVLLFLPLLILAACATPQEHCINDAAEPYRPALKEREDIAKALARGFVFQTEVRSRRVFTNCWIGDGRHIPCWKRETVPVTRRIPVDRAALRERDAQLARDLPSLQRAAERGAAACLKAFPEGAD